VTLKDNLRLGVVGIDIILNGLLIMKKKYSFGIGHHMLMILYGKLIKL
tara:strand:+ start:817 stop:960 length:144 start_codon:yes stop_codon:yes gene_type:complete